MRWRLFWGAAAVIVTLGAIPVCAAPWIESAGSVTFLSHAEMDLLVGGGTASCTDCQPAIQCYGNPTFCGQSWCLVSCDPAHGYSLSFKDCQGDSPSDCDYSMSVPCTWDVLCYCDFFVMCTPLGSRIPVNYVAACG